MTGCWHHDVVYRSVCPSVCNAVYCGSHAESVYRAKSCTSVFLAGNFLVASSDTFAVVFIV